MYLDASDEERRLISLIGAHTKHSQSDPTATMAAAREARFEQYKRLVDPDGRLSPEERERRAVHARKADMARLALNSVQARRNKARVAQEAARAAQEAALWSDEDVS